MVKNFNFRAFLGDYAVLLSAGFTHCTILILNSITSASSLIGFFIIASLSPNETVREYIFAVIAGVFMYIALGNTVI
jgi:zinc transporter 12